MGLPHPCGRHLLVHSLSQRENQTQNFLLFKVSKSNWVVITVAQILPWSNDKAMKTATIKQQQVTKLKSKLARSVILVEPWNIDVT